MDPKVEQTPNHLNRGFEVLKEFLPVHPFTDEVFIVKVVLGQMIGNGMQDGISLPGQVGSQTSLIEAVFESRESKVINCPRKSPKTGVRAPKGLHPCFRASPGYFVIY
jgi:hypothetical protein